VFDAEGNTYFLSFPPLAFYLSYAFFQVTGIGASHLPLRLIMWIASSLGALALGRAVRTPWRNVAAAVFLLSPVSLHYFGVAYFPLIVSIPLWMGLVAISLAASPRPWAVAIVSFALCYTDWIGYLAVVPFALVWTRRRQWRLLAAICVPAAAALVLTLCTYASIAGWPALLDGLRARFSVRSGWSTDTAGYYYAIPVKYYLAFAPVAVLFAGAALCFVIGRGRERPPLPPGSWTLLFCLALPVALDHILLLNHTAYHRYAVLKAAPAIGVALAMCLTARPWRNLYFDGAFAVTALVWSVVMFYHQPLERPPEVGLLTRIVQYQVSLDRVLFLQRDSRFIRLAEPALLLGAERNFHMVDNMEEARRKLRVLGFSKGLYIRVVSFRPPQAVTTPVEPGS
jgi:hypothetical protein